MRQFDPYYFLLRATLLFSLFLSTHAFAQCPPVLWADEFNGTSLNTADWNIQTGDGCNETICGWGNSELQFYQAENLTVSNGNLQITAKVERNRGSQYTSGRINTKNKVDNTYGRYEARIKLPQGDGLWPAFWMLPTDDVYGTWPLSGEIDIMEFTAANDNVIYGTIHYGDLYPGNQYQGNAYTLESGNFYDDYHEFAIEWEANEIRWFMDGILYSTKRPEDLAPFAWPFDQNFHILLNLAVGGDLGGPVDNSALPSTMEVDYVRIYDGFRPYIGGNLVVLNQAQGEVYTIGNVANNTNVTWSVPAGATIVSGQGSPEVTIDFGNSSGYVSAVVSTPCGTETFNMPVTVEPPFAYDYSFENFDAAGGASLSSVTGTLNEVSNPAPNAVNGSALVGEYTRDAGSEYDIISYSTSAITDADSYVIKGNKLYMDVYTSAPVGTEILLQMESNIATAQNWPDGRHSRYTARTTVTNAWERLVFSFVDQPDPSVATGAVSNLLVLVDPGNFTSDTYYIDNLDSWTVDNGGTSNSAPTVSISSPGDGSSFSQGSNITISASASDSDGSVASVEFFANGASLGTDNAAPYEMSFSVATGSNDLYAIATDNEGASTTSATVSVTGTTTGGNPTYAYVSALSTGSAAAGKGAKFGTASVTISDDLGGAVAGATVSGTFSGSFSESVQGTTDASGNVSFQTSASLKGALIVDFCVDAVSASLTYNSGANVLTCASSSARTGETLSSQLPSLYPNPVSNVLHLEAGMLSGQVALSIYGPDGSLYVQQSQPAGKFTIDTSSLPKGLFILSVQDEAGNRHTVRFTK